MNDGEKRRMGMIAAGAMRRLAGLAMLCCLLALAGLWRGCPAGEGARYGSPQEVWDAFLDCLRNGDMRAGYELLAPVSRKDLTYRDFCANWHPLTLKYEAVLSPPGFSEFRISGDLATLRLGMRSTPEMAGEVVQAVLVREDGRWWVIDGDNFGRAVAEAAARNVLRRLVGSSQLVRAALESGKEVALGEVSREMPRFFEETPTVKFFRNYNLEIDALRDGVVRARPLGAGLRGYAIGLDGRLQELAELPPQRPTGEQMRALQSLPLGQQQQVLAGAAGGAVDENVVNSQGVGGQVDDVPLANLPQAPQGRGLPPIARPQVATPHAPSAHLPPLPPSFGDPDRPVAGEITGRIAEIAPPVGVNPVVLGDYVISGSGVGSSGNRTVTPVQTAGANPGGNVALDNLALPEMDDFSLPPQPPAGTGLGGDSAGSVSSGGAGGERMYLPVPVGTPAPATIDTQMLRGARVVESGTSPDFPAWEREIIEIDMEIPGISTMNMPDGAADPLPAEVIIDRREIPSAGGVRRMANNLPAEIDM